MKRSKLSAVLLPVVILNAVGLFWIAHGESSATPSFWRIYDQTFKKAKYVDLTHTITPSIPVWAGFGPSTFGPALNPQDRKALYL
jgi:hypothetical protein